MGIFTRKDNNKSAENNQSLKYVYLMRTGNDHYKVGVATNIFNRLKALQTSSSTPIELVTAKRMENAFEVERAIHHKFSHVKVGGGKEWFTLTDREAIDIAVEINKYSSVDITEVESLRLQILKESEALHSLVQEHIDKLEEAVEQHTRTYTKVSNKLESMTAEYKQAGMEKVAPKNNKDSAEPEKTVVPVKPVLLYDPLLEKAVKVAMSEGKASTSLLQRKLSIGYGRAARIIEKLEERGVISELDGIKPRTVNLDNAQKLLNNVRETR
jgi:DNA segregation ATPase FtsK/SpoIIIE-like protein